MFLQVPLNIKMTKKEALGLIHVPRSRSGHDSLYNISSWLSNAGGEELGKDDRLAGWRTDATVPHRPVKCAPSFAGGSPAAGGEETSARSEELGKDDRLAGWRTDATV